MRIFMVGVAVGSMFVGGFMGWTWKDHVTSGDYFNVGNQFYRCVPASLGELPK